MRKHRVPPFHHRALIVHKYHRLAQQEKLLQERSHRSLCLHKHIFYVTAFAITLSSDDAAPVKLFLLARHDTLDSYVFL